VRVKLAELVDIDQLLSADAYGAELA
jgi:hypothetical protein